MDTDCTVSGGWSERDGQTCWEDEEGLGGIRRSPTHTHTDIDRARPPAPAFLVYPLDLAHANVVFTGIKLGVVEGCKIVLT